MMLGEASRADITAFGEVCFVRIEPNNVINTYGVGLSVWQVKEHVTNAASKVQIPLDRLRL
jgi:hypothetical protein